MNPDLILVRTSYLALGVTGMILDHEGKPICLSLERPWLDNKINYSCVPQGQYRMKKDIRHLGREDECRVWELQDVPGRSQIQLHIGNRVSESLGCPLVVTTLATHGPSLFGGSSRIAFNLMMQLTELKEMGNILITDTAYMRTEPAPYKVDK